MGITARLLHTRPHVLRVLVTWAGLRDRAFNFRELICKPIDVPATPAVQGSCACRVQLLAEPVSRFEHRCPIKSRRHCVALRTLLMKTGRRSAPSSLV